MELEKQPGRSLREALLTWIDRFQDDHYVFDVYGETVTVDLDRDTVLRVLDISILLIGRVLAAKGGVITEEYEKLEKQVRQEYKDDDSSWVLQVMLRAVCDDHLFGRYRDIEPMIGELQPRGYPMGTAPYLLLIRPEILKLIYAVIRHVDDIEENYDSLGYTFFVGVLIKGWGEGFGWSKGENGNWIWTNGKHTDGESKTGNESACINTD